MTLIGKKICIVSRCSQTLYTFRRSLITDALNAGADVVTMGSGDDGFATRLIALGIKFVHLPVSFKSLNPLRDLWLIVCMYREFRSIQPDAVQLYTIKPVIFGAIAAQLARVPVIVAMITGLGHVFTTSETWVQRLAVFLYRIALRNVSLVYFQNPHDRDVFLSNRIVSIDKVRMINGSGVDVDEFSPQQGIEPPLERPLHFLMIGRLLIEKGIYEFFEAASRVRHCVPGTVFTLVGDVDSRNPSSLSEENARTLAAEAGVNWCGHMDDVRPAIAAADVILLPSYREGTPKSLLEAAAMAKPLLASDVPGCTEVVIDGITGCLFPSRNAMALTGALLHCIRNPDQLAIWGKNARELVVQRFDVRKINAQLLSDICELTARKRP